jgi:preprotein translocase subunit SecE
MADNVAKEKKKRVSPGKFVEQVRSEVRKVTWPTKNEWFVTSVMVFIMVMLAAVFFFLVDTVIGKAIQFIIGLGS